MHLRFAAIEPNVHNSCSHLLCDTWLCVVDDSIKASPKHILLYGELIAKHPVIIMEHFSVLELIVGTLLLTNRVKFQSLTELHSFNLLVPKISKEKSPFESLL